SVSPRSSASATITQRAVPSAIEDFEKRAVLRDLIRDAENLKNAIIFCNRKVDVSNLWKSLDKHGFSVGALHGDMDQRSRMAMLQAFKDNKIQLLVASDVAARGLDIPDVSHVFNFDVPVSAEDYVHRIGRTGRAGRSGAAFMIVTPGDRKGFEAIEQLIGQTIEWQGEPVEWDDRARRGGRGRQSEEKGGSRRGRERGSEARGRGGRRNASPERSEPAEAKSSRQGEGEGGGEKRAKKPESRPARQPDREEEARQPAPKKAEHSSRKTDRKRKSQDDHEPADSSHPFGGEENIPAFLRG
ncbi:MAG: helicase C-terminal domain-containing protein, partial [Nitratireductor sp.]|nr:helicase C-terminal domain-containing protein [Nitratireductor sp.]